MKCSALPGREEARARQIKFAGQALAVMELNLTPETEAKLNELAQRTHRGTDELLQEAVEHLVTYNDWFERKVKDSIAVAELGKTVPDETVRAGIEERERS